MRLDPVDAFARRLHSRLWCVQGLPTELGARRFVSETGPDLFGVAVQGRTRAIGLSAAIVGTPLELPVIAHECGHLLLGHDVGFCSLALGVRVRAERDAWAGAALLAIPREAGAALVERRATAHDIAATFDVPRSLVYMRGALAVLLGEAEGRREWARQQLAASRRSLESWMVSVSRTAFAARRSGPGSASGLPMDHPGPRSP